MNGMITLSEVWIPRPVWTHGSVAFVVSAIETEYIRIAEISRQGDYCGSIYVIVPGCWPSIPNVKPYDRVLSTRKFLIRSRESERESLLNAISKLCPARVTHGYFIAARRAAREVLRFPDAYGREKTVAARAVATATFDAWRDTPAAAFTMSPQETLPIAELLNYLRVQ